MQVLSFWRRMGWGERRVLPLCTPPCESVVGVRVCTNQPHPFPRAPAPPGAPTSPAVARPPPSRCAHPHRVLIILLPSQTRTRAPRPAPADLLHAAASYAVFAAPASRGAGGGPSMCPNSTAPGRRRAGAAPGVGSSDPRPAPPNPAGPAPSPPTLPTRGWRHRAPT